MGKIQSKPRPQKTNPKSPKPQTGSPNDRGSRPKS